MIVRFGDWEIDRALFELRRHGAPVAVQPKVLALLIHLVSHRDRTVPKSELFEALWPGERVGEGSLTRAVRGARLAVGDSGDGQAVIRSVRGVGYRFVAVIDETGARAATSPAAGEPGVPLIGRSAALEQLGRRLERALRGDGDFACIIGPPGIGKTRLAGEVAERARALGAEVHVGQGFESEGAPPFWPFVQILRSYSRGRSAAQLAAVLGAGAAEIAQALPALADALPDLPAPPPIDPAQLRFRLNDSLAAFFRRAAHERPLVLVLDDLHCADPASLRVLHFLSRELRGTPLFLLGTWRDVEPRGLLRAEVLGDLARRAPDGCCELRGLEPDEVARYVEAATGRSPTQPEASALHERTGGNPLFLREVLAVGEPRPVRDTGQPAWIGPVAKRLEAAIDRNLEVLSERCRRTLCVASVIGRDFALRPLAIAAGDDPRSVLADLAEAVAARVCEETTAHRFRFTHGLIPEVIYAASSASERVRLHTRVGEALAEHYAGDEESHLAELAHHFAEAAPGGDTARAIDYDARAATRAFEQMAYEDAARHIERALATLDLCPADPERRVLLLLRAAEAWRWAGEFDRAREHEQRAIEIARALDDGALLARAVVDARTADETGRVEPRRVALLEEALRRLDPADTPLRVRVLGRLAATLYFSDPATRRVAVAREAVAMARRIGDVSALGQALYELHFALLEPDALAERIAVVEELGALARASEQSDVRARSLHARVLSSLEVGDRAALDEALSAQAQLAGALRHPDLSWQAKVWAAMRLLLSGDLDEADRCVHEALREGNRIQRELAPQWYAVQLYQLRREQGRLTEVLPMLQRVTASYPAIDTWSAALALLDAEEGRSDEALRRARSLCPGGIERVRNDVNRVVTLAVLAELAFALQDAATAAAVHDPLRRYAGRQVAIGMAVAGAGSVDRYLGLSAATLGRLDEAEAHFAAGVRADQAMGATALVAHGTLDWAALGAARGTGPDRRRALERVHEARRAGEALGNARLLRRAHALESELGGAIPLRSGRAGAAGPGPSRRGRKRS